MALSPGPDGEGESASSPGLIHTCAAYRTGGRQAGRQTDRDIFVARQLFLEITHSDQHLRALFLPLCYCSQLSIASPYKLIKDSYLEKWNLFPSSSFPPCARYNSVFMLILPSSQVKCHVRCKTLKHTQDSLWLVALPQHPQLLTTAAPSQVWIIN